MPIELDFLNAARTGDQENFLNIPNDQSININPNHADEQGYTALIWATPKDHSDIIRALLFHGRVDPDHADEDGETALTQLHIVCILIVAIVILLVFYLMIDIKKAQRHDHWSLLDISLREPQRRAKKDRNKSLTKNMIVWIV